MTNDIISPLRWVGGKRLLAPHIMTKIPASIKTYVEPFLGGGSVFLEVLKAGIAEQYVVADINHHVIDLWSDLRNDFTNLTFHLHNLKDGYDSLDGMDAKRERYYEFRREFNSLRETGPTSRQSALFLVLNRTAFNALVRYNGKGGFNSAFGQRETVVMEFDNLDRLHHLLNTTDVKFVIGDFTDVETIHQFGEGDFAYLDPPYHVLGDRKVDDKTYSKNGFSDNDERRLRCFCDRVVDQGSHFLMSNHECPEILEYFGDYPYETVATYKCFTGKASSRITTKEILLGDILGAR